MIKTADINSNECKTKTDFHFQCHCLCDIVSSSFFTHLKPIWFEKYLYLYRKGEQRNIYVKTFHSVYIAHHWVVEYKIVIFTQRYILIIIFGVFRWRMTKIVDCPNTDVENNTGYKIQCDRIAGIFHNDGKICGISDRNGIKESPMWICRIVDKMINYTGTDIYSVSVFKLFHYGNSSSMNFECITWKRDIAFKPGKWIGLARSWTSVLAVRYHVSEK